MTFETLGVTRITRLNNQIGNPIVNPGIFTVEIKGGPPKEN